MWDWIGNSKNQLTVLIALIPIVWAVIQYLWSQRQEIKHRQFETYHKLIKDLVESEEESKPMMIDRQVAIIYELRNYRSYYPVTLRILKGLKKTWSSNKSLLRLNIEIDESIAFIEKKTHRR